jgi:hypothetical protein
MLARITLSTQLELGSISQNPDEQIWKLLPQLLHVAPPTPQAALEVPGRQVLPSQQPLQLPGPQPAAEHDPPEQVPPAAPQSWQGTPPVPQAQLSLPPRHCVPSQQPGQLPGPQPGCWTQAPWAPQIFPEAAQSAQGTPPCPQAASSAPGRHWLFLQHPVQLEGEQPGGGPVQVLAPVSQVLPSVVQSTQAVPPLPQAALVLPGRHWLPWQQPLPQVVGLQLGGGPTTQVPDWGSQLLLDSVQSWHGAPLVPHRLLSAPLKHWPPWQQPWQVWGPQGLPPWQTCPWHVPPVAAQSVQSAPP